MFFLLRMTFWLGLVLVLLPFGSAQQNSAANEVSASEAISAASATVGDLRGFCGRQPDACAVGSQVASTLGYRAQAGAKMLYEVLSEAMAGTAERFDVLAGLAPPEFPGGAALRSPLHVLGMLWYALRDRL